MRKRILWRDWRSCGMACRGRDGGSCGGVRRRDCVGIHREGPASTRSGVIVCSYDHAARVASGLQNRAVMTRASSHPAPRSAWQRSYEQSPNQNMCALRPGWRHRRSMKIHGSCEERHCSWSPSVNSKIPGPLHTTKRTPANQKLPSPPTGRGVRRRPKKHVKTNPKV